MASNSATTSRWGLPIYTTADYADPADVPLVLNEVDNAIESALSTAVDNVTLQASQIAGSALTANFLLMGV